jgi:uncharacterized membrane protein YhaH (DUF805 family)
MPATRYLFSFYGRVGRGRWWQGQLLFLLTILAVALFQAAVGVAVALYVAFTMNEFRPDPGIWKGPSLAGGVIGFAVGAAAVLTALYCDLAISVKRCHDRGKSGWFLLVGLLPAVGICWLFVELAILRGEEGPNGFGSEPHERM